MSLTKFEYTEPEEKSEFIILPKGEYKFRILEINEMKETREKRIPMIPLKLEFSDDAGRTVVVYDNLLFAENTLWKVKQFLKCVYPDINAGRAVDFEDPEFIAWLGRKTGTAKLKIGPVFGKDYDRNEVDAYVYAKPESAAPPTSQNMKLEVVEEADDDKIPF